LACRSSRTSRSSALIRSRSSLVAAGRWPWRRVQHRVRCADGPERIAGEWWRRDGEWRAVRDYWAVEDEAGQRFWLYRRGDGADPATGDLAWFLHGLF
jgi:protein ImuB